MTKIGNSDKVCFQVNIPLMRNNELTGGIELRDENGERACKSKSSAVKGIAQVNSKDRFYIMQ